MPLSSIGTKFLDVLYPPRCFVCGGVMLSGEICCPECASKIPYIRTKRCQRCGKPVEDDQELCGDCLTKSHVCTEGFGALIYEDVMQRAIAAFKYEDRREYGKALGTLTYREAREKLMEWEADVLVPVPLHPSRFLKRGFNQAELIAEQISNLSGIPMRTDLLQRVEKTGALKLLTAKGRSEETAHAFSMKGELGDIRRIILVDDIYTTGSTVDAAAVPLFEAGAREVFFLAVCIGAGFMVEW